jgi:hypothetical protein
MLICVINFPSVFYIYVLIKVSKNIVICHTSDGYRLCCFQTFFVRASTLACHGHADGKYVFSLDLPYILMAVRKTN